MIRAGSPGHPMTLHVKGTGRIPEPAWRNKPQCGPNAMHPERNAASALRPDVIPRSGSTGRTILGFFR